MAKGTKALGQRAQLALSKNFYGPEPEPGSDLSGKYDLIKVFNWYNNFYEHDKQLFLGKDCTWLEEYLGKKYTPKDIAAIKRADVLTQSDMVKCRLLAMECTLPEGSVEGLEIRIANALRVGRMKTVAMFGDRIGPAERNKRKALAFRGDLDRIYDLIWDGKIKPAQIQFFETFKKLGIKPAQAQVLAPVYKEILAEEKDPEVSHSKKNQKARQTYLNDLVTSLEAWSKGNEEKPQPKVTKKVTERKSTLTKKVFKSTRPAATASGLKYKASDESSKLTSISPKQILGAQTLVLYNAKYNQLTILRAANAEGLSVKGTTILNVDEKTSEAKRAGRHVAAIKEMVTSPKTKVAKLFKAIESTPIPVRTRTSEDIILVRAIK